MDVLEKVKRLEQRARQAAEAREAERVGVWREIQRRCPDLAGHLKDIARVFGKPVKARIWLDDQLVWPLDDLKKTPKTD